MRYDSLLCHYLARELHQRLAGAPAHALRLDPAARVAALETGAGTLVLELHPSRGLITLGAPLPAGRVLPLHRRTVVGAVRAPADERLLVIELPGGAASRVHGVVVELLGNQWNLLALDGTGRVAAVLWPREAGRRRLRVGAEYVPPPVSTRAGAEVPIALDDWLALLEPTPPAERAAELVARVAWTSPLNASAILEEGDPSLEEAHARYAALAARPPAQPCVLAGGGGGGGGDQPYPLPLPGAVAAPAASLLEALARALGAAPPAMGEQPTAGPEKGVAPELLQRLRRRAARLERRARRLEAQARGGLEEAVALRAQADVLLANLHAVRKGAARTTLPDFAGGEIEIELDRALGPAENATRLYEEARRREHAATRVPALIAAVEAERARLADALRRAQAGEAAAEEVEALAGAAPAELADAEDRLPYRRYRTSGGLEARVGRSRKDNDELTFHHSSPTDIWLHARDVGGAHVILRWADAEANPPGRDLAEAAVLAALHSRSRTSGTVAVDWTRRKHVRKPRKSPPGLVAPDRVKTLFVEPDAEAERRMRS
jgi:predicted ribosome quality control (RQC) complex YloA/Tae2 family protein